MNITIKCKVISALLFMTLVSFGCGHDEPELVPVNETVSANHTGESEECEDEAFAYVHIGGAVNSPGVYEVASGSRLFEAIELAGGFTEDAATDYCNLAMPVEDGQQYVILTCEEVMLAKQENVAGNHYDENGLLDINSATTEELMELSGIGETRAEAIVAYRDANGAFAAKEDIMNVSGIKDALYSQIENSITVR